MKHLPGEGNLFTAKPERLSDLLRGVHRHRVALPNFQRPWVWDPEMVRDLIVSVAYRYPAGSLLTMPLTAVEFALRPFQGAGEQLKAKPGLMILDGQQRLTSLFQALYRQDGVHYRKRIYHFYLDLSVLLSDPDGIDVGEPFFDQSLCYVTQDKSGKRIRYADLRPMYELTTYDHEIDAGALPLGIVFDINGKLPKWREDYLLHRCDNELRRFTQLSGQWDQLIQPWLNRIRTYPFPVVELQADMPLGAICHIFEKVNSTGVPLDVFDLCNAILWAQGFLLNEKWAKTKKELRPKLTMQDLSGTHFLMGLSLLDSMHRERANPDQEVAVTCRKQDLMAMKRTTVEKWWPVLVEGYKEAAKFMREQGILASRILPYSTLIVPLSAIFADLIHRKGPAHVGAAWHRIQRWYWCSVFSQRYSSQVETGSAQDFEQVLQWIDHDDKVPDVVRTFSFRSDSLQEITSIRNAIYKGTLCLLARDGAQDFGGGSKLTTDLFHDSRQDHHHIFPTKALRRLKIQDDRANTIVNKTLISAAVNRSIGGRLPSQYIADWEKRLVPVSFSHILATHGIDAEKLRQDDWTSYVLSRREQLQQLILSACGGNVQPFSDADIEVEEEDDEDAEE